MFRIKRKLNAVIPLNTNDLPTLQELLTEKISLKQHLKRQIEELKSRELVNKKLVELQIKLSDLEVEIQFLQDKIESIELKQQKEIESGCFTIDASMTNLPEKFPSTMGSLLQIIKLLHVKYNLNKVSGKFDSSTPNKFSIFLDDNMVIPSADGLKKENQQAVNYFKSFKQVTIVPQKGTYLSYTVVTFDQSNCDDIIKKLKSLPDLAAPAVFLARGDGRKGYKKIHRQ